MGESYYELLGLTRDATAEEIRQAYFLCVRKVHPDASSDPNAKEKFIAIQTAYEVLIDKDKRREYDLTLPSREYSAPLLSTRILLSKSQLPRLDEPQLLYALLEIECLAQPNSDQIPQSHFCFVIDRSTSMNGSRMGMVKANLLKVIPKLKPNDLVSLVTFSDRADILLTPTPVKEIKSIEAKINKIFCSGGTEIYRGLKSGVDLLWHGNDHTFNKHLLLLTDGHTYGDEESCFQLAKDAFLQGIMISGLGIGHEWNDPFLDKLSSLTGGSTLFVTSQEDLYNYLNQQVKNNELIYARNLTLEYESPDNVSIRYGFRLQPDIMPLEIGNAIPIGDLFFGKKSQFLFEFLINPTNKNDEEIRLLKGRIKMDLGSNANAESARILINSNIHIKDNLEKENPPVEIIRALSKLTLYKMQEKSREDVSKGEYLPAVKRMHYLASKVLSQGETKLAKTILFEAESVYNNHHYSQDGDKRLKYGTKALFLLPEPKLRSS